MKKYFPVLRQCSLFDGIEDGQLTAMLSCLGARVETFEKKYTIFPEGKPVRHIGILLSGSAQVVQVDYYGNRSIMARVEPGELFGEAFACAETEASEYSIGYINKKHEMVQLVKKAGKSSGVYILDDGDAFIYGRNGNLYKAEKRNKYEPEKIASDIMRCAVTQSGLVYYTDDENVLYSVKNSKKTEIMEDVDGALTVSPDGILYFLADYDECGDLYMCKDGKKAQKIASDVAAVSVMPNYSYYVTEMEKVDDINVSDLYVSFNGKKFEKILEEVTRG